MKGLSEYWDIDSYSYVNEYGDLMLNEECYETLKIPKSLCPFMLFSFRKHTSVISNYRYDFGPKLLEFLGVNTKFGVPTEWSLKHAYEEDLKSCQRILYKLSFPLVYKMNMYDHNPTKKKKAILKKYSDLEKGQNEWDLRKIEEEGREQYLRECKAMNISLDDDDF